MSCGRTCDMVGASFRLCDALPRGRMMHTHTHTHGWKRADCRISRAHSDGCESTDRDLVQRVDILCQRTYIMDKMDIPIAKTEIVTATIMMQYVYGQLQQHFRIM